MEKQYYCAKKALNIVNEQDITKDYPISRNETSILVHQSTEILNRYSGLFRASTYSPRVLGHDDYLYVLKATQEKLDRFKQEIDAEINSPE